MTNLRSLETSVFARRTLWVEILLPVGLLVLFLPPSFHFFGYLLLILYACAQVLRLVLGRSRRAREQRDGGAP